MALYKGAASEAGRAINLLKKRQKEQEEIEMRKKKIEDELKIGSIQNKFATHYDAVEQQLKSDTIGLVTLDEMKAKQEDVVRKRESQLAKKHAVAQLEQQKADDKKKRDKQRIASLSFNPDDDDDDDEEDDDEECHENDNDDHNGGEDEDSKGKDNIGHDIDKGDDDGDEDISELTVPKKKRRFGKNPEVDTSFLPDRDREEEENKLREVLRKEWSLTQDRIKNEEISITYSYWDGSGHRRQVKMKKGNSIQQFLQKCLENLRKEFNDLKTVSVDQLMFVKEDLIIPQHYTFYDFVVTKARGKSGALFSFNVYEDVRITNDHRLSKDESHAGKVCMRSWYERNKHIFPASRWEPYDPEKKWDHYTVSDKNAAKITVK